MWNISFGFIYILIIYLNIKNIWIICWIGEFLIFNPVNDWFFPLILHIPIFYF